MIKIREEGLQKSFGDGHGLQKVRRMMTPPSSFWDSFGLCKRMFQQGAEGSSFGGDVGCSAIPVVKFVLETEKITCASECSAWLPLAEVRACFNRIGLFL